MTLTVPEAVPARARPEPPLAGAYRRLTDAHPALRVRLAPLPSGADWVTAGELTRDPEAVRAAIAFDAEAGERDHGTPLRPDVAAGFCFHRWMWPAALAFTLPWFLERRVPRLPVGRVAFHRARGELTVDPVELVGLPGDPLAAEGLLRTVPDEAALRAELLDALAEHMEPMVATFRPWVRRGPRTLWGTATDDVVEGLWFVAGQLGEEERAVAELTALLPGGGPAPYVGGASFRATDGIRTRTRATCCLFYTVDPNGLCFTCPRQQER
ncbi:FhuF-like iron-sulfur protein [Streptomyces sp. TLI_235]|nr:(2Fe-2S)-binding protein [Streptomyces sp. TLI_235]PBC71760.1 FhuF-like iron-sulfur protein [Streptomyces sp. TLI_235]